MPAAGIELAISREEARLLHHYATILKVTSRDFSTSLRSNFLIQKYFNFRNM